MARRHRLEDLEQRASAAGRRAVAHLRWVSLDRNAVAVGALSFRRLFAGWMVGCGCPDRTHDSLGIWPSALLAGGAAEVVDGAVDNAGRLADGKCSLSRTTRDLRPPAADPVSRRDHRRCRTSNSPSAVAGPAHGAVG